MLSPMPGRGLLLALALGVAAFAPLSGQGATTPGGVPQSLFLQPVGAFQYPVFVTSPPGDQQRMMVVQQGGLIKLVLNGVIQATPFLDAHTWTTFSPGGDLGLLSVAFAPDYATTGRFYVYYTDPSQNSRVDEVLRDANDPNVADPSTRRQILTVPHPTIANHYGAGVQFGPDGMLYIATGDGGCCGDPFRTAQNLSSNRGKILRIDPRETTDGHPYAVPPNNPFVGRQDANPEIWSFGLRNPWRYSFDRLTGDLTLGDVGQDLWEEIDYRPVSLGWGDGTNFGWSCFEGRHQYNPNFHNDPPCKRATPQGIVQPVFEYPHNPGCSVTGGYVVHDTELPLLAGRYVYGDYCTGQISSQVLDTPDSHDNQLTGLNVPQLASFGEDACGHVYAMGVTSGGNNVFRIQETDPPPPDCVPQFPLPVLHADVGLNDDFVIHLYGPDGQSLDGGTLPEGSYTVEVDDYSTFHNFEFEGLGTVSCVPNSECATQVGEAGHETWTVNFTPGLVEYLCEPHRGIMHGQFTVTGVGPQPVRPRS
jgi:glucose/arabinose dehydrogenase